MFLRYNIYRISFLKADDQKEANMDKFTQAQAHKENIEKKWKRLEEEGCGCIKDGIATFTSVASEDAACTVDIDENLHGLD